MRYTEQPDQDVRTIPAKQIWVGVIDAPNPYVAIACKHNGDDDEEPVIVCRFDSIQARGMAERLIEYAASIEAPNN